MTTRYLTTDQNGNGDQTYWDINGYFLHGPSGEKLNLGGGNTTVTASNEIVQIGTSYLRIPQGISNERPNPSYAGMIRYLTNTNVIEYYKNDIGDWLPISEPSPNISNINPDFVSSGATGQSISVFGTNFVSGTSVSFIGQDLTVYNSGITTSFINNSELSATVPSLVTDNSSNDPYSVKVTNPSGLSNILSDSLNINERPVFTTLQNPNTYATVDACFNVQPQMDLSASDFGNHFPLTYDECGNILSTKNLTLESSGAIVGIPPLPSLYTALSYNETFTAIVTDASSAVSIPGEFKFVVQRPINTFTQTGGTVTYADTVNGVANNTNSITPYINGSVIIKYTNTSGSHNFIPSFPISVPVQTMIVGGGGGGGSNIGGGGGAGGVIITEILTQDISFSAISIGSGGAGGAGGVENDSNTGTVGNNTTLTYSLTTLTANGGGYGGRGGGLSVAGGTGGSGGGGGGGNGFKLGGASNQGDGGIGYSGGRGSGSGAQDQEGGGGGGGAGFYGEQFKQIGSSGGTSSRVAGAGGIGIISNIDGTNKYYAGGGGGGYYGTPYSSYGYTSGLGGQGGGGNGGTVLNAAGSDATSNSGSGGGGSSGYSSVPSSLQKGGDGGSGIVILRFPYISQVYRPALNELIINDISNASINIIYTDNTANGGVVQTSPVAGGYTIYEFICGPNTDTTIPSFNGLITFTPNNDLSNVDFLVVAGGGGGHGRNGAGGGAGGLRTSFATAETTSGGGGSYQSTLDFSANNNYNVVIGNGGGNYYSGTVSSTTGGPLISTTSYNGGNSSLQYNGGSISCTGGGGGTGFSNGNLPGSSGGSGGGGGGSDTGGTQSTGGAGTSNEGFAGGNGNQNDTTNGGGGGGGAGSAGSVAVGSGTTGYGGNGGAAINSYIKGNSGFVVAGGGGGGWGGSGSSPPNSTSGGTPPTAINSNQQGGGSSGVTVGGRGGFGGNTASDCIFPTNPTPHTGSGGAGGGQMFGTSGSSGVICIRFPSFA